MRSLTSRDWWAFAAILVVVGVLFSIKQISNYKNTEFAAHLPSLQVGPTTSSASENSPVLPSPTMAPPAPLNAFHAAVLSCFGDIPDFYTLTNTKDLSGFVENLNQMGIEHEQRVAENFRYRLSDGSEQRLELVFGNNESSVDMHLYGLDVQGRLVPMQIPSEDEYNPPPEVVQSYLMRGVPLIHQVHRRALYRAGLVADFNEINDRLAELAIQTPSGNFYCRNSECRCRP